MSTPDRAQRIPVPEPISSNPLRAIGNELRAERRASKPFPRGDTGFSVARTRRLLADPLGLLLDAYSRHGPVFTLRILHSRQVFAIGPEANHQILVSNAENFRYRDGGMSMLIPLLGDGIVTTDGAFHRQSRQLMLPSFHRERVAAAYDTIRKEAERSLTGWTPGMPVRIYDWGSEVALRIALRVLCGFDPGSRPGGVDPVVELERAVSFFGHDFWLQMLRGPGTPYAAMRAARRRLDSVVYGEIRRRRRTGERGEDVFSLLLDAQDEDGSPLTDQRVRDEVITLLVAFHTVAPALALLLYELARHPEWAERAAADEDAVDLAMKEALRLYPPAWMGVRRCVESFTVAGVTIPGGVLVNYSSWATHRLPDVWDDPHSFRPERFAPNGPSVPRGAYLPFGGGSRTCLGMRLAELVLRTVASFALREHRFAVAPGYRLALRSSFTLVPEGGLPLVVSRR